jgi:hypothetical protein
LGTVGKVRFCVIARFVVYGDPGGASVEELSSWVGGDTVGPCEGPLTGPATVAGCSRGAGSERGSGAGALSVRVFVNSILVAIEVLGHISRTYICLGRGNRLVLITTFVVYSEHFVSM